MGLDCETTDNEATDRFCVRGTKKDADSCQWALARSFVEFLIGHTDDEIEVVACFDLPNAIEAVEVTFPTGTHQDPKHDVRAIEPLLVMFQQTGPPIVASLRRSFPLTQHTYGLEVGFPTDAQLSLCIDDRAWEDASSDYNGAEIVRRIASWFNRAISGKMNDELQFRYPVFLPSPASIIVSEQVKKRVISQEPYPVFLALSQGDSGARTFFAHGYDDAPDPSEGKEWTPFLTVSLAIQANNTGAMWHPPGNLGHLRQCVSGPDNDLLVMLRDQLIELWSSSGNTDRARLKYSNLLIHVIIKNDQSDRFETFWLLVQTSLSDIAVGLGILWPPNNEVSEDYVSRLPPGDLDEDVLTQISLMSANSFQQFGPELARQMSGLPKLANHAAVVGVGSIGSQVVLHLAREGAFDSLSLIDGDRFLPHNTARHVLTTSSVSQHKSTEVAALICAVLPDYPVDDIAAKLSAQPLDSKIQTAFVDAQLVIDLTASVGAGRDIADYHERGRAISAFFNPRGDAYVILCEDKQRKCDLAILEASYYAEVASNAHLADHLTNPDRIIVSSGQCRSVSNRLSSTDAALLSAAASRSIRTALTKQTPSIIIGTIDTDGSLKNRNFEAAPTLVETEIDGWTVRIGANIEAGFRRARSAALSNEAGGVLLGIVDHRRQQIEVAMTLPAPVDSKQSQSEFVRGVQNLRNSIDLVSERVMHQLTYIGEWHSHPRGAAAVPSIIDCDQLSLLADSLAAENRPGLMIIVGEKDTRIYGRGK